MPIVASLGLPIQRFVDNNGKALANGRLYSYQAGSTNFTPTYRDSTGTQANTNPIILNSRGETPLYLNVANLTKLVLKDVADSQIAVYDNLRPPTSANDFILSLNGAGGADQVGFMQNGTGAVLRTLQDKVRDVVSVKDFGAVGDGATNDAGAISLAKAAASDIYFPAGTYLVPSSMTISSDLTFAKGAMLSIPTGVVVTLTGSIDAGPYQIFTGAGTVAGSVNNDFVPVAWWGALPGVSGNQSLAIQAAINFAQQGQNKQIRFASGQYQCDTGLTTIGGIALIGPGNHPLVGISTILNFTGAVANATGILVTNNLVRIYGFRLENMLLTRTRVTKGVGGAGLIIQNASEAEVRNVVIQGFDTGEILTAVATVVGTECSQLTHENVNIQDCATQAVMINGCYDASFHKLRLGGSSVSDRLMSIQKIGGSGVTPNGLHFRECVFVDAVNMQPEIVRITGGFWITFDECVFEQATAYGIVCDYDIDQAVSLMNVSVNGCWFNACGRCVFNAGLRTNLRIALSRLQTSSAGSAINYDTSASVAATQAVIIEGNVIENGGASGSCIELHHVRGAVITGNSFYCTGAGVAQPSVTVTSDCDQIHVTNNHSMTTNADANGFNLAGTNPVTANNTKATA